MTALHDPELIKALASWVGQQKNPYFENKQKRNQTVKLMSSSPNAWMEITQSSSGTMEITCIHRVIEETESIDLNELRRECRHFNDLMDRIRLPAYIWEERSKSEFQLRWQEKIQCQADLKFVQHFFEQSLYLANALQGRLGWALNMQTQPRIH